MSMNNSVTPRMRAKPSEFMLPPSDWRTNKTPGGRTGKIFSKAPRFPEEKPRFGECVAPSPNGSIAHTVKKLPNAAGATFRSKTPQRPEPQRPLGDVVTNPGGTFGGSRAKSPATSCFKSSCSRFPFDDKRRPENARQSVRQDQEVLTYQGLPDWRKTPFKANQVSAAYRSTTDRFGKPARQFAEYTHNVPTVTPRGQPASCARSDRKPSAWARNAGTHDDFLPG